MMCGGRDGAPGSEPWLWGRWQSRPEGEEEVSLRTQVTHDRHAQPWVSGVPRGPRGDSQQRHFYMKSLAET